MHSLQQHQFSFFATNLFACLTLGHVPLASYFTGLTHPIVLNYYYYARNVQAEVQLNRLFFGPNPGETCQKVHRIVKL